jgi:DNA-binding XRE family transcriptional regulator
VSVDNQEVEGAPGRPSKERLMATITLPEIARRLREKRGDDFKTVAARTIGVSRQVYGAWEDGHFIPGDEWAEPLAAYLDEDIRDVVWLLYRDRLDAASPRYDKLLEWVGRPTPVIPLLRHTAA